MTLALDPAAFVGARVMVARGAAQHSPATAGWDLAELFDVDMDHVPAPGGLHTADDSSGGAVQPAQLGHSVSGQHPMHGGGMQSQQVADSGWPPTAQDTDFDDAPLRACRRLTWAAMRPRAAIGHPRVSQRSIPGSPAGRRGHRNLEPLSGSAQRPTILDDTSSQPQTTGF